MVRDDLIAFAGAHKHKPALAFPQLAKARAKITLDAAVLKFVPIAGSGLRARGWLNGFCQVHDVWIGDAKSGMKGGGGGADASRESDKAAAVAGLFYPADPTELRIYRRQAALE